MKLNTIRTILIILLFSTFGIIFGFSSQDATESKGISRKVTEIITNNIKSIQEKNENEKREIISHIERIVRKLAHFSIYTVIRNIVNVFMLYIQHREYKKICNKYNNRNYLCYIR